MNEHAEKSQDHKNQLISPEISQIQSGESLSSTIVDNRPEADTQRMFQEMANNSPGVSQLKEFGQLANTSQQAKQPSNLQSDSQSNLGQPEQSIEEKENKTGLPDKLKAGIENLSGQSLDDVKVHRNSDKPAQLQAHAYAQGTDIQVAPGQEKHLPHEAWHVVQQKQGRVKPTMQMMEQSETSSSSEKNAININDDAGLEKEADVMGSKAMNMPALQESAFSDSDNHTDSTTQLQKEKGSSEADLIDPARKFDTNSIKAEEKVNPKSIDHKKRLDDLKNNGANMGEEARIKLDGELTGGAKVNRFFGNESTYSKLLRKVEGFNKTKDVAEKQNLLKELKPLARTWLERHDTSESAEGKQDENETLKRESIYKFLNQTTSNYPAISEKFKDLQIRIGSFIADPITNRSLFHQAVGEYAALNKLIETYKSTYPPSVNLLYLSELDAINGADAELTKSGLIKGAAFDSNLGFSVKDPEADFNLVSGKYWFSGNLEITLPGISASIGTATVEFNSDESLSNITVDGTSCKFEMDGVELEMSKFNYDYKNNTFIAEEASGSLTILGQKITLTAYGASIKQGVSDFDRLEGKINGSFDTEMGVEVINPTINYFKGQAIEVEGELNLTIENLLNATGSVGIRIDHQNNIENIDIKDGASEATIGGLKLILKGITYSEQKLSVEEARGEINIFENPVALTVSGVSIENNKFDFEKIEGELPDIDYGFFSLTKTTIAYSKAKMAFEGKTKYHFNTTESPDGFSDFTTNGEVEIHCNSNGESYYSIENGALTFKLMNQKVEAINFNYNSKDQTIAAEELSLSVDINDFSKTFTGNNIGISKAGIDFEELKTEASGHEFNVKIFTLKPKEYSITKNKNGGLQVNAYGSMSLGLPEYLGIKSTGEIEGDVGLSFDKSPPDYHITKGKAAISMPNPLNKISEILGENWSSSRYELSATIPVFPAVSAIFGIYIQYGLQFANEIAATIELDSAENSIILEAKTNFPASVEGGIFGGIQGGSQLLIALALLLRASGAFDMKTEIGYAKKFPLGEQPTGNKIKEDSGFTYNIQGEATVGANLDIVATALYFFRKQFSLKLGEKSLGKFEFSNEKKSDPDMGGNALADRKMLDDQIDPSHKKEAKGLTIEELLTLDYSHRFKGEEKEKAIDVIKSAETGRAEQFTKEDLADPNKFNNVPLANLQFYIQFIDNRCNWEDIYQQLESIGESLKSEGELKKLDDKGKEYLQKLSLSIKALGESSNIAQAFVTHYNEKVGLFLESYSNEIIAPYHDLLLKKGELLQEVESMKRDHLHSGFWGDKSKQAKSIQTGSFFGKSNYDKLSADYSKLRQVMLLNKTPKIEFDEIGKQTAFKLVQDHQRKIEKNSLLRKKDSSQ